MPQPLENFDLAVFLYHHPKAPAPTWVRGGTATTPAPLYAAELTRTKLQIRNAAKLPSEEAVRSIEQIVNRVQSVVDLADAKLRIHVRRLDRPEEEAAPKSLERALEELGDNGVAPPLLQEARRLICATLAELPGLEADLGVTSRGAVDVAWRDTSVQWIVNPSRIPWPGVNVRALYAGSEDGTLTHRSFRSVASLLEHLRGQVAG